MENDILEKIDSLLPPEEELEELAELFKVFGDPTRLKILNVLRVSELCVQDIATAIGMSDSAVSHQLRVLKQSDLVKNRREGKTIYYSLSDTHVEMILNMGQEHVEEV